ncbi:MAG: flagellar hook-length control protein FliK [Planctomycetia bacterium]|nr:flagellar hook-length control protein FliK [Planctomycetia bacterium]
MTVAVEPLTAALPGHVPPSRPSDQDDAPRDFLEVLRRTTRRFGVESADAQSDDRAENDESQNADGPADAPQPDDSVESAEVAQEIVSAPAAALLLPGPVAIVRQSIPQAPPVLSETAPESSPALSVLDPAVSDGAGDVLELDIQPGAFPGDGAALDVRHVALFAPSFPLARIPEIDAGGEPPLAGAQTADAALKTAAIPAEVPVNLPFSPPTWATALGAEIVSTLAAPPLPDGLTLPTAGPHREPDGSDVVRIQPFPFPLAPLIPPASHADLGSKYSRLHTLLTRVAQAVREIVFRARGSIEIASDASINLPGVDEGANAAPAAQDESVALGEPLLEDGAVTNGAADESRLAPAQGGTNRNNEGGGWNFADKPAQAASREADGQRRVELVQRLAGALQAAQQRQGEVVLRLTPPDLGLVRVHLVLQEGALNARLEAQTRRARALLLENLSQLRQRLTELDVKIVRLDVDLMDQSFQGSFSQSADEDSRQRWQQAAGAGGGHARLRSSQETGVIGGAASIESGSSSGRLDIVA